MQSLEFQLDQVRKSNDDVLFWLRLSDVAEVDKVSIVGPPNPRGKERYGIANERHPIRFAQYVFTPKKLDRSRKHPVVVLPHGGVHGDFGTYHVHIVREMLEKGWVVLAPEYRGSTGYGKDFHDAIDYGGLEVDDVVAGLDWAVSELPYVDGSRAAIAGWSHGGLIALLAVMHHPEKWKAAYAGVPVTDLVTRLGYHEQSYEDLFAAKNHVGKKVVEDVDEYRRRSPVFWAGEAEDAAPDPRHDERPRRERDRDREPDRRPEGRGEDASSTGSTRTPRAATPSTGSTPRSRRSRGRRSGPSSRSTSGSSASARLAGGISNEEGAMAGLGISAGGFLLRLVAAAVLVFATYNPAGYSYVHWVREAGGGPLPLKVLAGIFLAAGWLFCVRSTLRSLGHVGTALAAGFFGVLIWLFVDWKGADVKGVGGHLVRPRVPRRDARRRPLLLPREATRDRADRRHGRVMSRSVLRAEIGEQPDVLTRLLVREGPNVRRIARALARHDLRFVLIAARGTSDNAARYAQYALGLTCRLPVALAGPSLVTLYDSPLAAEGSSRRRHLAVGALARRRRDGRRRPAGRVADARDRERPREPARARGRRGDPAPRRGGEERRGDEDLHRAAPRGRAPRLVPLRLAPLRARGSAPSPTPSRTPSASKARPGGPRRASPTATRVVVLSRGLNYPTAHEIALKLKELALLDAEALSGADFRHGPIALAGPKLPAIVVSPPGTATEADLAELAAELRRRGSPVLLIGPAGRGALPVPRLPELLSPIVAVVPGQLLAFHAARARGLDPDAPRGLSKVTETR